MVNQTLFILFDGFWTLAMFSDSKKTSLTCTWWKCIKCLFFVVRIVFQYYRFCPTQFGNGKEQMRIFRYFGCPTPSHNVVWWGNRDSWDTTIYGQPKLSCWLSIGMFMACWGFEDFFRKVQTPKHIGSPQILRLRSRHLCWPCQCIRF